MLSTNFYPLFYGTKICLHYQDWPSYELQTLQFLSLMLPLQWDQMLFSWMMYMSSHLHKVLPSICTRFSLNYWWIWISNTADPGLQITVTSKAPQWSWEYCCLNISEGSLFWHQRLWHNWTMRMVLPSNAKSYSLHVPSSCAFYAPRPMRPLVWCQASASAWVHL